MQELPPLNKYCDFYFKKNQFISLLSDRSMLIITYPPPLQVITISSSQSASPVTSTTTTSTLQPLVKLDPGPGAGMGASRPMQKYIVVSLPSSASSSLDTKSSSLATSNSSTPLEPGMKLDRSESPGANTQSPH